MRFSEEKMRSVRILTALMVVVAFASFTSDALAQKKKFKAEELLSINGAQGKEFWISIPPNEVTPYGVDELEIYIASAYDTDVLVYDAGGQRQFTRKVTKGDILTLSDKKGETNWAWEVREFEVPVKKAVRITSKQPISVYVLNSKPFTSDGYLAIPTASWGMDYISCSYYDFRERQTWAGGFLVISKENGTQLDIDLRGVGELDARTAGGKRINTGNRIAVTLDEGEVYMVKGDGQTRGVFDLTGSRIRSTKPVGFLPFHERTTMPNLLVFGNGRNHLVEMMPPVNNWGKRYATVEYKRENLNGIGKGDVFRVVASQANTKWSLKYYDKASKALLGQGGGVLAKAGDFADVDQSGAPTALTSGFSVWNADKPVFVMQYSCSQSWDGDPILDPFMINVVPKEQFITSTIFQSPTAGKFGKHRLNLIVWADSADPEYINNLKSLAVDSIPVWSHPNADVPRILFTRMPGGDNLHWCTVEFGSSGKSHTITCNGKIRFGGYIYGFGAADAYGWPAASGFRPTTSFDTLAPVLTEIDSCGDYDFRATEFRNIPSPPTSPPKDSDQVETGISDIDFVEGAPNTNYRIVLQTAQTFPRESSYKDFKFRLEVIDKGLDAYAEIRVSDFGSNNQDGGVNVTYDTVFYFAAKLIFNPTPLTFGKRRVGTKPTLSATVSNGQVDPIAVTELRLKTGAQYKITSGAIPPGVTLAPGQAHSFTIEYDASHDSTLAPVGVDVDTLIVKSGCSEFRLPITGFALEPKIKVDDFDAGTVGVNELRCGSVRIENPGSDTLVITDIQGYQGTNFNLSNPYTPVLPIRIPPKGVIYLERACYQRGDIGVDDKDITLSSNAASGDSISTWTGDTQEPGPNIIGYNWRQRRVNTVHQALGYVYNTGNQSLTLRDVTFMDGTKFYPPGSDATNYVFQIVGVYSSGQPVTSLPLVGTNGVANDSAEVLVLFRPAAEIVYVAPMKPVFDEPSAQRTADLEGEGILPQIALVGWDATCAETPYGQPITRSLVITNLGTMPLTIQGIAFAAGTNLTAWQMPTLPPLPLVILAVGGTFSIPVQYTRAAGNDLASQAVVEILHDAVPGNGTDSSVVNPVKATQAFNIGSCSGPDIVVTDLPYGRQLANCETPTLEFRITNTGGGLTPLEIREINAVGPDAAAFVVTGITRQNGAAATLPVSIPAGEYVQVAVRFTPTEPNAAPWADRAYSAQFEVKNYQEGDVNELRLGTVSNATGIGYVVPISFDLTNDMTPGQTRNPGATVLFSVATASALWTPGNITNLTVDVLYQTNSLVYIPGTTTSTLAGWTVAQPVVTTDAVDPTMARMSFVLSGPAISANTGLFDFKVTLLLGSNFVSAQTLEVLPPRPCIVTTTTGDSTAIFNCALVRRVVAISGTQTTMAPPAPNPVSDGTLSFDFGVGISAPTSIDMVDAQGNVIRKFIDGNVEAGEYTLSAPTAGLPNGAYFLRMRTLDFVKTQRIVIID